MVLPVNNLSFSLINQEFNRLSTSTYTIDDAEGRKTASAGNTGQSLTPRSPMRLSNLRGHARRVVNRTASARNVVVDTELKAANYAAGLTYATYRVDSGVVVGSASTARPSMLIQNTFTNGDIIELVNLGRITGAGGSGGAGDPGQDVGPGTPGSPGGVGLSVSFPTELVNQSIIAGGGGGGGGGSSSNPSCSFKSEPGGGGGGGAGDISGPGGPGGGRAAAGQSGTITSGGSGGAGAGGSAGGRGGDPGQPGQAAPVGGGAPGGGAGRSINGYNSLTIVTAGTILGPTGP